jgi:hypothetical protein
MKKLFAVALVGTASTTGIAMRTSSTATPTHEACGLTSIAPAPGETIEPVAPVSPVAEPIVLAPDPETELVIEPLALGTGSPACGNVTYKGSMGPRPCTTAERAVKVIMRTALAGTRPSL